MRAGPARAFTLLEMLTVIAVIAILTGILIPVISGVRARSEAKATRALLEELRLKVEAYQNDFGDYPPSRAERLRIRGSNGKNEGIECLLRCLTTTLKAGPYAELKEEQLGNLDQDQLVGKDPTASSQRTAEMFEVIDRWGNPLVYWHHKDYDRQALVTLVAGPATVAASRNEKTGQYHGLTTFQLWSAGPDGAAGTDDDIRVWGE